MQIVPVKPLPNQTLVTTLDSQFCQINLYQRAYGLNFDLLVNNDVVIQRVLCQNENRLVRNAYLGFRGDFLFIDTQVLGGKGLDPVYTGLGSRFVLGYLSVAELALLGVPTKGS
jgi:hypothetical protein